MHLRSWQCGAGFFIDRRNGVRDCPRAGWILIDSTPRAVSFLGLALIAFGTGGIKPCVSAFGGDQFKPGQERQLKQFFSLYYVSVNAGSLISTFVTPIFRNDIACFDRTDCYPLAFGVPAVLMVVAVALFILGRFVTRYQINPPQKDNVIVMVCCCVGVRWPVGHDFSKITALFGCSAPCRKNSGPVVRRGSTGSTMPMTNMM